MNSDLRGKHALVCGGSEGIGRACAEALAALGADVTVLARRAERLAEVVSALPRVHQGQHHDHLAHSGAEQGVDHALQDRCIPERQELFWLSHAPRLTGGKYDP